MKKFIEKQAFFVSVPIFGFSFFLFMFQNVGINVFIYASVFVIIMSYILSGIFGYKMRQSELNFYKAARAENILKTKTGYEMQKELLFLDSKETEFRKEKVMIFLTAHVSMFAEIIALFTICNHIEKIEPIITSTFMMLIIIIIALFFTISFFYVVFSQTLMQRPRLLFLSLAQLVAVYGYMVGSFFYFY